MQRLLQTDNASGAYEDVHVVLAGDAQGRDAYVDTLRSRIDATGLAGRVHLVGHVADVPAAYLAAHVTVVASIEPEAFGRAAAEAQAMGCPVIATRIGAPPETVKAEPETLARRHDRLAGPPSRRVDAGRGLA